MSNDPEPSRDDGVGFSDANRPVHLARRDVGVERAVERLSQPMRRMGTAERSARVERVIELLQQASQHARLAARSPRAGERERDFLHFLGLTLQQVESAHALIQQQAHLESKEHGFLSKFLGVSPDEVSLSAINFQRRAEDLLEGLWQVLRMSSTPYRELQRENLDELTPEERERYERACASFREETAETAAAAMTAETSPTPAGVARNAGAPAAAPGFAL